MRERSPIQITIAVIFALVLREMRGRFGAHKFGAFWILFEPLAHITVLMAIHRLLRGTVGNGIDYSMFLVVGVVPFLLFKNIALKGMEAVNANKGLLAYRQIKPIDTIVARTVVECALMACVYAVVLFGLGMWTQADILIHSPIQWIMTIILGIVFSFGLGLIFCVLVEAVPESKTFIKLVYMPLYFISGIIMPIWIVPERFYGYLLWNPYLHIIDLIRIETFATYPKNVGVSLGYSCAVTLLTLFVGLALYRARRLKLAAV